MSIVSSLIVAICEETHLEYLCIELIVLLFPKEFHMYVHPKMSSKRMLTAITKSQTYPSLGLNVLPSYH